MMPRAFFAPHAAGKMLAEARYAVRQKLVTSLRTEPVRPVDHMTQRVLDGLAKILELDSGHIPCDVPLKSFLAVGREELSSPSRETYDRCGFTQDLWPHAEAVFSFAEEALASDPIRGHRLDPTFDALGEEEIQEALFSKSVIELARIFYG